MPWPRPASLCHAALSAALRSRLPRSDGHDAGQGLDSGRPGGSRLPQQPTAHAVRLVPAAPTQGITSHRIEGVSVPIPIQLIP
jgi:hypothetical protein